MSRYPSFEKSVFQNRRSQLADRLRARGGGVVLLQSGVEVMRNRDADYPFRCDSYFYYLTGFPEPQACLALVVGADGQSKSVLFCRPKDEEREIWDGFRFGPEATPERFGFDQAHSVDELDDHLETLLANQPAVFLRLGHDLELEQLVMNTLGTLRGQVRKGIEAPHSLIDVSHSLDEMRLIKGPEELSIMKRAGAISAEAHRRAMRAAKPGLREYQLEAELLYHFRQNGSEFPAYGSIVATGANACVLHYLADEATLKDGDLVLIDAGCELDHYASDITRTFPVSGRFSKAQQAVYEVVLAAQEASIEASKPGARFNAPHDAAVQVLTQGLIDLKLLEGDVNTAIEEGAYKQFYMHRTGHWIGMDVHDCGSYRQAGAGPEPEVPEGQKKSDTSRVLEPGMVMTIEPGLYIRPASGIAPAFHNIGIRIEDDAIVTEQGCEIYTDAVPKTVADIEAFMR